jgi:hypothetical protein
MPEKFVESILASRLFAPFLSFVGVAIMVLWKRGIVKSLLAVAVLAAPVFTVLIVPIAVAWIRSAPTLAWLPTDGSVEGLIGFTVGLSALNLVAIVMRLGRQAETEAANRLGGQ